MLHFKEEGLPDDSQKQAVEIQTDALKINRHLEERGGGSERLRQSGER